MTIGELLERLRPEFPDLTISKIRFYDRQGLLHPQRSAAGYRRFSEADVSRLRYVLTAARDRYLPLKVIKAELEAGADGAPVGPDNRSSVEAAEAAPAGASPAAAAVDLPNLRDQDVSELRLTRRELLATSGLSDAQLVELEQYGLITRTGSASFDGTALLVAKIVAGMAGYGIEARHLRSVKAAADREVALLEQVVGPALRQRNAAARAEAAQAARELAAWAVRLHALLVDTGLNATLTAHELP